MPTNPLPCPRWRCRPPDAQHWSWWRRPRGCELPDGVHLCLASTSRKKYEFDVITWASIEARKKKALHCPGRLKMWDSTVALLLSIGGFSSLCSSISCSSCIGNPIRETPNQMPPSLASHWFHFPPDHFGSYLARYDMAQEVGLKCFGGAIWTCILLHKLITLYSFAGSVIFRFTQMMSPNRICGCSMFVWHGSPPKNHQRYEGPLHPV